MVGFREEFNLELRSPSILRINLYSYFSQNYLKHSKERRITIMRSEERLKVSYGKQKDVFESARKKKISNLEDRKRQLEEKIEHLNYELETTKRLIQGS